MRDSPIVSFPATGTGLIAISESVLSDSRDLRRHFRVVPATDSRTLGLAAPRTSVRAELVNPFRNKALDLPISVWIVIFNYSV